MSELRLCKEDFLQYRTLEVQEKYYKKQLAEGLPYVGQLLVCIHEKNFDCGRKPKMRYRYSRDFEQSKFRSSAKW